MGRGGRLARLFDALDDRTGYRTALRFVAGHRVDGGARYAYAFGSALLFVFILQIVTGVTLASVYSPSVTDAWGSVYYIQHRMLLGSVVRGIHHFGSSAMIVLAVLHMTQVLMFGAHRKPREVNWILGVLMLLVIMGFGLTGYLLPWDQKGYWATQVATGIIGSTPGGEALQTLIQGGTDYGNATLTRFYVLHVFILPGTLAALVAAHLALFYRHGVKRSPRARPRPTTTFWPYQMLRDLVFAGVVFGILVALTLAVGVSLEAPADPASGYEARPEWYFLPLFQLLKYFEGPLTIIGTIVLPALALTFLLAVPFLDRRPDDAPPAGPARKVLIPYLLMLATAAGLTIAAIASDASDEAYQEARAAAAEEAERAKRLAHIGGIDASGRVVLFAGHKVYVEKGCASCHDDPQVAAPRLAGYGTRERTAAFLKGPDSARFYAGTPLEGLMDPVEASGETFEALVDWLMAQAGPVGVSAERLAAGRVAFDTQGCTSCHNAPNASVHDESAFDPRAFGPDLAGYQGFEWTRGVIRSATHPSYFGGALSARDLPDAMPDYTDLSDDELSLLVRWLLAGAPGAL